jgi:hypothetical protein
LKVEELFQIFTEAKLNTGCYEIGDKYEDVRIRLVREDGKMGDIYPEEEDDGWVDEDEDDEEEKKKQKEEDEEYRWNCGYYGKAYSHQLDFTFE